MSDQGAFHLLAHAVMHSSPAALAGAELFVISWYPLAVPGNGTVHGEVHWLRGDVYDAVLAQLDAYEGDEFARQVRSVQLATGEQIPAWVYLGDLPAVRSTLRLAHGNWRAYHAG